MLAVVADDLGMPVEPAAPGAPGAIVPPLEVRVPPKSRPGNQTGTRTLRARKAAGP